MTSQPQANQPLQAALCVIAAMAMIGYVDNLVVQIAAEIGLWQFHFIRAVMGIPMILALALAAGWRVRPRRVWAVGLRGLLLAASMLCYFGALGFLSVAQAVAGLFTAPLFVLLISALWFRAPVSGANIVAVALGFAGTLLVLQPDPTRLSPAIVLPVLGGVFYAFAALTTRRICAGEGAMALLLGFFTAMLLVSGVGSFVVTQTATGGEDFLTRGWTAPSGLALWLTFVQAVAAVVGVGLITRGYILAEAPMVAVFEYSLLIFAALWGWWLWGQTLDPLASLGILAILGSGALLFVSERRRQRQAVVP